MSVAVIQQLLAPVVMISACGLLCLALYNRLSTIVARIRAFNRERLDHALGARGAGDTVRRALAIRTGALEKQIPRLLARARLIHHALMGLVVCVLAMLLSSLAIGLGMLLPAAVYAAVACFVAGVASMLLGMIFALAELRGSLGEVRFEAEALDDLPAPPDEEPPPVS